jgi:two-component system LytT family response regulator
MIKAVIVEDETASRKLLQSLLEQFCEEVVVIAAASNVFDAYQIIIKEKPELVFLDIEMQSETGFDLLSKFDEIFFEVIFTTAYEQYAIKAIKLCAIDYLLKPIDIDELKTAVTKAIKNKERHFLNKKVEALMHNKLSKEIGGFQLALPSSDGLTIVQIKDILYLKSDRQYTLFYLKSGEHIMTSKNIGEYEVLLYEHQFLRVHHSSIINLNEARKYIRGDGGAVVMSNDISIDISKRKKENFLKHFLK